MRPMPDKSTLPIRYCSDDGVQAFIEHDLADWNPYRPSDQVRSAEELFAAARARFGDWRCVDLLIWKH
jgi:hypothetical protein